MEIVRYVNTQGTEVVFKREPPFFLKDIEGVDAPENVVSTVENYNQDGVTKTGERYESRSLIVRGHLVSKDSEDKAGLRRNLIKVFSREYAGTLFYTKHDKTYSIDVEIIQAPIFSDPEQYHNYIPFQIMLKALDPYWCDSTFYDSAISLSSIRNLFEFPLNLTNEFEFATIVSGDIIEIENPGDMDIGAVFYMSMIGPVTTPKIYNILTQEYFGFSGFYGYGVELEFSTVRGKKYAKKINGTTTTNAMSERIPGSTFLTLRRGTNFLQVQADEGLNKLIVSLKYKPLVIGV
ncbi:MAG: phage tail domain-containing protein [Saccharofermentanales bacterium]